MASKLSQMQARFQQKQMQEKEEKLLKLFENQQQRTIERVSRGSAGSDGILTTTTTTTITAIQGGKVRQMFDERRQKAGIDRSYPLEPLKSKTTAIKSTPDRNKNINSKTIIKSTVQKSVSTIKNGKPAINKREVIQSAYTNENGNENYEQERHHYENDSNDTIKPDNDLVTLMNNHNLNDYLDNEEMPNVELDVVDEPTFTGKLANVGGKLPSQSEPNRKPEQKNVSRPNGKILMSQPQQKKPAPQKSLSKPQSSPKRTPSVGSRTSTQSDTTYKSTSSSPSKTNMSAKRPSSNRPSVNQERAPSTNRPSIRQNPRGPQSAVTRDDLATCKFCNRRFAPDRLQIHEDICARTAKKKRKIYDATKHRVQGTELEPFARKSKMPQKSSKPTTPKKSSWRQTHDEFISTIRAAKMAQVHVAQGGKLSDLPPPPVSSNPDYVQCPHCGRRFNESAAARHIPKCATYEYNKSKGPPVAKSAPRGRGGAR